MEAGQVGWLTGSYCAACDRFPTLSQYNMSSMPLSFDWRALGAVTEVKNQAYCGSCWTFSTAGDIEGKHFLAGGNLTSLSEQQIVECDQVTDEAEGCNGGYQTAAFQYLMKTGGLLHDTTYPYKALCMDEDCGTDYGQHDTPSCKVDLVSDELKKDHVAHISGWQMVSMGAEYEETMALAMLKNGPISISINANAMDYYIHGITGCAEYDDCEAGDIDHHTTCDPTSLDHAVLLVGYGTSDGTDTGLPYWIVKNSLGGGLGRRGLLGAWPRGKTICGISNFWANPRWSKGDSLKPRGLSGQLFGRGSV
eukprot:FR741746.1.p1 GENE.FR741746.1~~FR741746.1.p1  ORF type:complete len:336 (+),score=61.98 FR741746.1:86-1009(+)